jgi:signal transduction histidine kinase
MERMSFSQRATLRKIYFAQHPSWRHPLVGYMLCPFIAAIAIIFTLFLQKALGSVHFSGSFLILSILFTALFWGTGPALLALVLDTVLLDYYFIPPIGHMLSSNWQDTAQLIPFVIAGLTIALITAQRERARLRALGTEQELQAYAEELEIANQTKDQFLSIASHELKTPITSIRGHAQLTLRRLAKQKDLSPEMEEVNTTLKKINDQTSRLTSLIDELMDVSSIRAGKLELRKQKCDLRDICRAVVEDQRLLSERTIVLNMPDKPIMIQIDHNRMEQVFVNLINNAIKYSSEEQPIEVILKQSNNNAALVLIKDFGQGIPEGEQEHIFETFYRTPDAQTSSKHGLGLGLAIVKDIVERHNGRIWCESTLGQGSTFFIEL